MGYNEARALEIALINLLTEIQKGNTRLSNEIEAVSEAAFNVPEWLIEVKEATE
jgi:hypothetical protein